MKVGAIFTYSAYMMTHWQQMKKETDQIQPLVNEVSYNSKRLFANMKESFRRDDSTDNNNITQEMIQLNNLKIIT